MPELPGLEDVEKQFGCVIKKYLLPTLPIRAVIAEGQDVDPDFHRYAT